MYKKNVETIFDIVIENCFILYCSKLTHQHETFPKYQGDFIIPEADSSSSYFTRIIVENNYIINLESEVYTGERYKKDWSELFLLGLFRYSYYQQSGYEIITI